ncbi:unnamed protein product, partial [Rotaria sordida]
SFYSDEKFQKLFWMALAKSSVWESGHEQSKIKSKTIETEVYVASAEKNFLEERMKLCTYLWKNGFKTEMAYKCNPKLLDQLQYCEKNQIELCVIIGSSELETDTIKIRDVITRNEFLIPREQLIDEIRIHLNKVRQRLAENKQQ